MVFYETADGATPLIMWLDSLDRVIRARIKTRIDRLESSGNFGDWESLGGGLYEMRFDFGSGYRIYYGLCKERSVMLICGGAKNKQKKDIMLARCYLADYKMRDRLKES